MRRKDDVAAKKEIAARLREIRSGLGMTQEQFSEILELSVSAYKKIESGENQISIECLRKLEQKLKVSSDYVLFGRRADVENVWKQIMNCTDQAKMLTLCRLMNSFVAVKGGQYLTQEVQSMYDKKLFEYIEEKDI